MREILGDIFFQFCPPFAPSQGFVYHPSKTAWDLIYPIDKIVTSEKL